MQTVCGSHVFYFFPKTPPHTLTAAVGGKRDRQIYRIDFTFNLRQKRGGNSIALLPRSAEENKNTCNTRTG